MHELVGNEHVNVTDPIWQPVPGIGTKPDAVNPTTIECLDGGIALFVNETFIGRWWL